MSSVKILRIYSIVIEESDTSGAPGRGQSEYLSAGCFGSYKSPEGVHGRSPGKIMAFPHIYSHFRVNEPIF